jgi:hypothetical protein
MVNTRGVASLNSKLRLKFSKTSKIQNNHIFDAKFKLKPKRLNCWCEYTIKLILELLPFVEPPKINIEPTPRLKG